MVPVLNGEVGIRLGRRLHSHICSYGFKVVVEINRGLIRSLLYL